MNKHSLLENANELLAVLKKARETIGGPVNGVVRQSFDTRLGLYYRPGISFFKLESEMYPNAVYPNYYNFSVNGGPPGGRRSFVSALTRRGIKVSTGDSRICHGCLPNPERLPGGTTNSDTSQPLPSAAPVDRVVGQSKFNEEIK